MYIGVMKSERQPINVEKDFVNSEFPVVFPDVYETEKGTNFLTSPGVAVVSVPDTSIEGLRGFFGTYSSELNYMDYLRDKDGLLPTEELSKFAGQLCYMSFGPERTKNIDAQRYFYNIMESGHGSVLEHANVSMLFWGVSRSLTHELIRHRAGFAYSQVSQRYVGGKSLRFVERPEFAEDTELHQMFEERIDRDREEYERISEILLKKQEEGNKGELMSADSKTDRRKKVRQAARAALPNETEAPIIVTGNIRAWRHFLNMRGSEHAEVEIRKLAVETYRCLMEVAPMLLADFEVEELADGTKGLKTMYPKV